METQYEFLARSRYVAPMFFGDGAEIAVGDQVEAWSDNIRVRARVESIDGEAIAGTVEELEDDCRKLTEHSGLTVGGPVAMRQEHVRTCWKRQTA